jgi:hypothetical protein
MCSISFEGRCKRNEINFTWIYSQNVTLNLNRRNTIMKTKKLSRKLAINKKTVANLNPGDMAAVNGGRIPEYTLPFQDTCDFSMVLCLNTDPKICTDSDINCP